jgi:anti-sigma B factor antagonist
MKLETFDCDGVTVVVFIAHGLIASNVDVLKQAMPGLIASNARFVFDIGDLEFVDSVGLGTLVGCLKQARQQAGDIRMCRVSEAVSRIFELVKLERVFQFYGSMEEAVNSFASQKMVE